MVVANSGLTARGTNMGHKVYFLHLQPLLTNIKIWFRHAGDQVLSGLMLMQFCAVGMSLGAVIMPRNRFLGFNFSFRVDIAIRAPFVHGLRAYLAWSNHYARLRLFPLGPPPRSSQ